MELNCSECLCFFVLLQLFRAHSMIPVENPVDTVNISPYILQEFHTFLPEFIKYDRIPNGKLTILVPGSIL